MPLHLSEYYYEISVIKLRILHADTTDFSVLVTQFYCIILKVIAIGGCRIIKAVNPYLNYSECEFCQNIKEVTNFKLAYEYIFVTVSFLISVAFK